AQDGLFTLVERGLERGQPLERTRLIGSISRALLADAEWHAVRNVVARPELQVIVSNVTEGAFRLDAAFPPSLTDLLYTRFERLPDGPSLFVIPTELVDDNGPRLAAMVDRLAEGLARGPEFREWLSRRVRFWQASGRCGRPPSIPGWEPSCGTSCSRKSCPGSICRPMRLPRLPGR